MNWDYLQPVKIRFGKGRVSEVKDLAKEMGIKNGLLVADPFFFTNGLAERIVKESEGAIIANLEEYDLSVLPIIRSDGTALYPVADLALAVKKFKENKIKESIYIVDVRQGADRYPNHAV